MRLQELSETEYYISISNKMQLVCEDRLHISQVGAVGSSLGSCPRGRQFESGTLQHHFLGDTKVRFISFLVIIERHIVRENSMPFKMVLWCNGSTRDFGSLRDCSSRSRTTFLGKCIFYV